MLIIYAQNVYYLYASRFLLGFVGGAVFVVIPIMVAEIAEDRYVNMIFIEKKNKIRINRNSPNQ